MAFQFNATSQEVRSLIIDSEPFFVAKDICDILELSHTTKALKVLDNDEKLNVPIVHSGQNRKMLVISESGLYRLIFKSIKPEAKAFQKWVTSEVLPSIRKNGYYGKRTRKSDFIDARDVPFKTINFNQKQLRVIHLNGIDWFSITDCHKALCCATDAHQTARKLNVKQVLSCKIWLFGNTHPSWFTTQLGLELIASGSCKFKAESQLNLAI